VSEKIDLHIHSSRSSDGDFTPFHIIRLAKESKLRAISITDHDTVAAYPEALEYGEEMGVEVVPSIELTTLFDGREFHLLLPFVNWKKRVIAGIIDKVVEARVKEAKERVRKLREMGFDISWREVLKKSRSNPPLGVFIAKILLDKAEETKDPAFEKYFQERNRTFAPYIFYEDYFMEGKPAYVPKRNVDLLEILQLAPQTEGVPVLAHPGAYFQQATRKDLLVLKENRLQGLEVYTSYHSHDQTVFYEKLACELNLVPVAGSDFHGRIKPHIPFASLSDELRKRRS